MVEETLATTTMTVAELDAQMRKVMESLASAAATATQNATSCQELRVTAERIMKTQEAVSNKVNAIETQVLSIGTRLTSLESTITSVLPPRAGPVGHREDIENQGIASERALGNAIILHKRRTVDAAISLALLQEAQLQDESKGRYEQKRWHNAAGPGKLGPHPAEAPVLIGKAPMVVATPGKFDTLKAQRRARGECFKCGGKFGPPAPR